MLETVILTHYTSPLLSPVVHAVQSDTGRVLVCKVTDFVIPSGAVARFRARKPDDKLIFNTAKIIGRTIRIELTSQLLAVFGTVKCNIEILHNDKKVSSFDFAIEVDRLLVKDVDIESTNEFSYLDETVDNAKKALEKANNMISLAETAATNANEKAEYAKEQGNYAKAQGDYAKEQGDFAKTHGETAQSVTLEAKTATEQANAAAQNAKEQGDYAKTQGDYAKLHGDTAQTATQTANAAAENVNEKAEYAKEQGNYAMIQGDFAKEQGEGAAAAKVQAETATQSANNAAQSANQAATRANSAAAACEGIAAGSSNKAELITFDDSNSKLNANNVQIAIDKTVEKINANTRADKILINDDDLGNDNNLQEYILRIKEYIKNFSIDIGKFVNTSVVSKNGVHDIRYHDEQLQVKINNEWVAVGTGSGGIPVGNVDNLNISAGNNRVVITWSDPKDVVVDGVTIAKWKGTKLVMKAGACPENERDGQTLLDNQIRDKYKVDEFIVGGLTNNIDYYFALFPYTDNKVVTNESVNKGKGTPKSYRYMEIRIDKLNSNTESSITYLRDAANMTQGSEDWDEFFGYYPCLLKDGKEVGRLQRNDFTKFEDGRQADITSGDSGDVMIAFPYRGMHFSNKDNRYQSIIITDNPTEYKNENFAHKSSSNTQPKTFYISAYLLNYNFKSLSNDVPYCTGRNNIFTLREKVIKKGSGYAFLGYVQFVYIQYLLLFKYKTFDISKFLNGNIPQLSFYRDDRYTEGSTVYRKGWCDKLGMNVFDVGNKKNKIFGLELFFSHMVTQLSGIYCQRMDSSEKKASPSHHNKKLDIFVQRYTNAVWQKHPMSIRHDTDKICIAVNGGYYQNVYMDYSRFGEMRNFGTSSNGYEKYGFTPVFGMLSVASGDKSIANSENYFKNTIYLDERDDTYSDNGFGYTWMSDTGFSVCYQNHHASIFGLIVGKEKDPYIGKVFRLMYLEE